jgi:hypothetical protein
LDHSRSQKSKQGLEFNLEFEFEYTARDTPQQNSLAEKSIANMANRGRALMNAANFPKELRFKIWREVFQAATYLDGVLAIALDGKLATRYEHWGGSNPKFVKHLRIWGEAGTVKIKTDTSIKLNDRRIFYVLWVCQESRG